MSQRSTKKSCMFCDRPADHKCGPDHDACGNCCGMMGGLASNDDRAYHWIYDVVIPAHEKRIRKLKAKRKKS